MVGCVLPLRSTRAHPYHHRNCSLRQHVQLKWSPLPRNAGIAQKTQMYSSFLSSSCQAAHTPKDVESFHGELRSGACIFIAGRRLDDPSRSGPSKFGGLSSPPRGPNAAGSPGPLGLDLLVGRGGTGEGPRATSRSPKCKARSSISGPEDRGCAGWRPQQRC